MAEIELVIKIDEETFQDILDSRYISPHIKECFRNAKSLPKGHGDLIDKKELLKQPMDFANYPSNYVKMAQTIIKADD